MKPNQKLFSYHPWFHLTLIVCLALGVLGYTPSMTPGNIALADPPPPFQGEPVVEGQSEQDVQLPTPPPPAAQGVGREREREAELRAGLAALEIALQQGPEAVLALRDTLRGEALDMAMNDIVAAHRQLALQSPPRPATPPLSLAEEEAMLQAQATLDAASRARALARHDDPVEGQSLILNFQPQAFVPNAPAADRTVGAGCDYATIGAAITAASPGDRLRIEGGVTFNENVNIYKNLTLEGGYNGCASGSSDPTTIDGGGVNTVIKINTAPTQTVALENLNITNGNGAQGGIRLEVDSGALTLNNVGIYGNTGQYGAGLWVGSNTVVTGTNVNIYNNTASTQGGGVRLYGGRATFVDSDIHDNSAPLGAGVYGTLEYDSAPQLNLPSYADIHSNDALSGDGFGGGVYMREGTVSLADCSDLYYNDAIEGGGAYLVTSTLTIQSDCSEIMFNTATGNGGGVYAVGSTVNMDLDAALYDNTAGTGGIGSGGGAYLDDSALWGDKASIHFNTAATVGGGVYATNNSLLDMDLGGYPCAGPRCSQLSDNTATNSHGGGVYLSSSTGDLRQTFVENNTANSGGAVFVYYSTLYFYNSLIAGNNATNAGLAGDGLHLMYATVVGSENTLAYNPASGSGQAIFSDEPSTLSLTGSIVWGHAVGVDTSGYTITCSDIEGGYAGADNMNVNPLFVNPGSANFHLQSLSPVIDRCASGQSVDFDNEARPITYIRPATPYDMGADEAGARVGINGAGCAYGRIQDAVDAASPGDTIQAAADVFTETVDVAGSIAITIAGGYDSDCVTYITGTTTIDGSAGSGSTLDVSESTLLLRDLNITGGDDTYGGGVDLVGGAQLTLDNTDVFDNQATYGGGLYICTTCAATATNDSDIYNNTALDAGGGARVWGRFVGADTLSDIYDNSAPDGGGLAVLGGTVVLNGSDMSGNQATGVEGKGGGIYVDQGGVVTLTNNAYIYFLNRAYNGGGIYAAAATVYLQGSDVVLRQNIATNDGGAVYLSNDSTLYSNESRIGQTGSTLANKAVRGAGIYAITSTVDFRGRIINNVASSQGAGIYADNSTINLDNAQVGGTGDYEANQLSGSVTYGGGLYLTNGTRATLNNTTVSSNTFPATGTVTYGGGAYVTGGSVLTLTDSTIERHLAPSASDGRGAGVYLNYATLTLDNSQVISNTAGTVGGGVRMWGTSTLNVLNGSELRNNYALNGEGGAVTATNMPTITISNSALQDNSAHTDGGAIYLNGGTLDFTGQWDLRWNHAGGNGGAVAVEGTGDASFRATGAGSSILNNQASGDGGALYVHNTSTLELHSTNGHLLSLGGNTAGGNGGAAFADNGAYFDVYGRVVMTANQAVGNGGAFYLSGGSRLWLDDYVNDKPQLLVNQAQNGGAVYAHNSPRVECDGAEFGYAPDGNQATAGAGGALYLSGSAFDADNCTFHNGQATQNGGAIAAYTSTLNIHATYPSTLLATERPAGQQPLAPQAILATPCNPLTQQCSAFYGNVADSDANNTGDGGALYVYSSTLQLNHTYLHRNSARAGGAIYQAGAGAVGEVANSLIYSNTVSVALGAGIRNSSGAFTVTHVTLANNLGGSGFSGVASAAYNTIAWGNSATGFATMPITASCNIDDGGLAGPALDPQFVAPGAGEDYHLRGSSPAIDACAAGLSPDLDNTPRPFGGAYDMGAYEYPYGVAFTPNHTGDGLSPGVVMYTHTLTNTGGVADTFALTAQSDQGWGVTIATASLVTLASGASMPITVTLSIPVGVLSGTVDTTVITATSASDSYMTARVTDTTAAFTSSLPIYTLTVNVVGNGSVTQSPSQTAYISGTVVQLTAGPDPGWTFIEWSGDLSGSANPDNITMDRDKATTATFAAIPTYTLTVDLVGNGLVTQSPSQTAYISGTIVQLTAEPDPGWTFIEWSGDLTGSANPDSITMDDDKLITATFVPSYTLAVNVVGNGSVTRSPSQTAYISGTVVQLTAEPDPGWYFIAWSGDLIVANNPVSLTMDSDKVVTATFDTTPPPTYTLMVNVVGNGSVTRSPSQMAYISGTLVQLTAEPDPGWTFIEWSGDLSVSTNPVNLTMDGDKVVTATFSLSCVDVSGASFTFAPTEPVVGETVTFTGSVAAGDAPAYAWDFGDDSTLQTGNPIVHTFPSTSTEQTYTVVMTASNSCPSQNTVSHAVTVRPHRIYLPLVMRNYSS